MRVPAVLAVGLVLLAAALGATLLRAPRTLAGANWLPMEELLRKFTDRGLCQSGETLPAGTTAIRMALGASLGPALKVRVLDGDRVVTSGRLGSGWIGRTVTVPVRRVSGTTPHVTVCLSRARSYETLSVEGAASRRDKEAVGASGEPIPGRLRVEYLQPGSSSWLSLVPAMIRRMGLGRAGSGSWIAFLLIALMSAAAALALWLTLREVR